ncbi:MAG: hypothetical protein LBD16_04935 [Oscillospiraceae bacterium]|jgi:hypothetical protein|nr:hypothetical protein [Oscillospiraceae bacterium]
MNTTVYQRIKDTPTTVYDERDLAAVDAAWRRSLIIAAAALALFIASCVTTVILRQKLAAIAISVVLGSLFIFFWGMKAEPVRHMRKHLREIHSGLTKTTVGRIMSFGSDAVSREGIECFAVLLNVGETGDENDERLFYWNAGLAAPRVSVGDTVSVISHGNDIVGFAII